MPRYKYNPDGTLTILDDSPSSHQPGTPSEPPGDGGGGNDGGGDAGNGFPLLRARAHVISVILIVAAFACLLCSCSELGGDAMTIHKMSGEEWAALQASEGPHNAMDAVARSIGGREASYIEGVPETVAQHDWGAGFAMLEPGTGGLFENLKHNWEEVGKAVEGALGNVGASLGRGHEGQEGESA